MGRTTGTAGRGRAIGTVSMTGGLPDTGTGPPRTSCSKLEQEGYRDKLSCFNQDGKNRYLEMA